MRRVHKISIAAAAALVLVLGGVASFAPIVRAKASAQAELRGATVEIDRVRPGAARVWLHGVMLSIAQIPALELEIDALEVSVGTTLGVRGVRVHGGRAHLRGSPAELSAQ